jgi:hypothetical protein
MRLRRASPISPISPFLIEPGRPGPLPAQGSHRSGLAQLRHPARQATVTLCPLRYPLSFRVPMAEVRGPRSVSRQRPGDLAPPSLVRVPAVQVPRCCGTTRCSDFLPPVSPHFGCPSLGDTILCACVRFSPRPDAGLGPGALGSGSTIATRRMETAGSPRFLENPHAPMPCSH